MWASSVGSKTKWTQNYLGSFVQPRYEFWRITTTEAIWYVFWCVFSWYKYATWFHILTCIFTSFALLSKTCVFEITRVISALPFLQPYAQNSLIMWFRRTFAAAIGRVNSYVVKRCFGRVNGYRACKEWDGCTFLMSIAYVISGRTLTSSKIMAMRW